MDKRWSGATLRYIRTLAGKSLDEAAAAAGVSSGAVSSWENGRWMPGPEQLAALAALYEMDPHELAGRIGSPLAPPTVRPVKEWYDGLRSGALHSSPDADGPYPPQDRDHVAPRPPRGRVARYSTALVHAGSR